MISALSERQAAVLSFLVDFYLENDQLPPMQVIANKFEFSVNAAQHQINQLRRKKYIEHNAVGKYKFSRRALIQNDALWANRGRFYTARTVANASSLS